MESRSSTHPYELFANNFGHAPKQHKKGEGRDSPEMRTNFWSGNLNERELGCLTSGVRFEFNWLTIRLEAVMKLAGP
jgi:hypothetical protein